MGWAARGAVTHEGSSLLIRPVERGYEGYVAKDEASVYEGGATRRWLKKQSGWTVEQDGWRRRIFEEDRR